MSQQSGFTLIEVMISVVIAAMIFMLLSGTYIISQKVYLETDSKAELSQNGRVILDRMIREVRQTPDLTTQLPFDNSDPEQLPSEIMFQDGHDTSEIKYIRYFMDGSDLKRQVIVFYFPSEPAYFVHDYDTDKDPPHNPPVQQILEEKIIGEYVDDLEFWGDGLLNINLYLSKNSQSVIINTAVYGRNL